MRKLFTSILNDRIKQYFNDNHINETQAGFRQEYSTLEHIFILVLLICFIGKRENCFYLFVDYKNAFDMVWREGLWYKFVRNIVNGKILNAMRSIYMCHNITSSVMVEQHVSDASMECRTFSPPEILPYYIFPGHIPPGHIPPGHFPPRTFSASDIFPLWTFSLLDIYLLYTIRAKVC